MAFRLTVTLASLVPAELLPVAVSRSILKGMIAARVNRKHTLNNLAGMCIIELVDSQLPEENEDKDQNATVRVALASCLVRQGSANFDSLCGIPAVGQLLEGLDDKAILAHVQALVDLVVGACGAQEEEEKEAEEGEKETEEGDNNAQGSTAVNSALQAVEALTLLAKNPHLQCRGAVCAAATACLVRVACFAQSAPFTTTSAATTSKSPGKKGKKAGKAAATATTGFVATSVEPVAALMRDTCGSLSVASQGDDYSYPAVLCVSAASKLLTLLGDYGHLTIAQLNTPLIKLSNGKDKGDKEKGNKGSAKKAVQAVAVEGEPTVLQLALEACDLLKNGGMSINASAADAQGEEADGRVTVEDSYTAIVQAISKLDAPSVSASASLCQALSVLSTHAVFQMLCGSGELSTAISEIARVAPSLLENEGELEDKEEDGEDDEEEEEEESRLVVLLEACLELMSQCDDKSAAAAAGFNMSVKGLKDGVKRAWTCIGKETAVGLEVLEQIVQAVVADDVMDEEEEEEEEEEGEEEKGEKEKEGKEKKIAGKKRKAEEVEEEKEESEEEDEEEEEEIVLGGESALDLLAAEESDDEEAIKGMVLEHSQEADGALMHMLEMRRQTRKAGLLEAKKKQMTMRSRAVDILEALMTRVDQPELIMPLYPPLLVCLRKTQVGLTQSLPEGRAFESRLRTFVTQKMCSKKISLATHGDEDTSEGIAELVEALVGASTVDGKVVVKKGTLVHDLSKSHSAPLRQLAHVVFVSICRGVLAGDCTAAKTHMASAVSYLCSQYFQQKNSKIPSALVDDIFNRFPAFAAQHSLKVLGKASGDGRTPFLRAEACRQMSVLLKRFAQYDESAQAAVAAQVPSLMTRVAGAITSLSGGAEGSKSKDAKNKRLRPALQCAKDLAALPVCAALASAKAGAGDKKKQTPKKGKKGAAAVESAGNGDSGDFLANLQALKAAVQASAGGDVASNAMRALLAVTGEAPEEKEKTPKKNKGTPSKDKDNKDASKGEKGGANTAGDGNGSTPNPKSKKQKVGQDAFGKLSDSAALDKAEQRLLGQRAAEAEADADGNGVGEESSSKRGGKGKGDKGKGDKDKDGKVTTETKKRKVEGQTPWHA